MSATEPPPGMQDDRAMQGRILCSVHGMGTFDDGACLECKQALATGDFVSCPLHGMQPKNEEIEGCPACAGEAPPPNPTFAQPTDIAAVGVSPKPTKPGARPAASA